MSPNTQVALIALTLFFALASLSIVWPRLTGLKWSSIRLASGVGRATIEGLRGGTPKDEAERQNRPQSLHLQVNRWFRTLSPMQRIGAALGLCSILLLGLWLVLSGDQAQRFFGSPLSLTILFVYTLALTQYLAVSVRPLLWRFGYGADPEVRRTVVYATSAVGFLLTCVFWVGVQIPYATPPTLVDRSVRTAVEPQNGISDPVLAYERARQNYVAAQSELESLAAAMSKVADVLRADPLALDPRTWPSREQLTEVLRKVRAAHGSFRSAWASVPQNMRSGLEPPPPE
jgi:succinate dehydrogenase/fumarate reductase cytochrome b subunit